MSYPINYPIPQGANVQIFYTGGVKDWVKPQGASFVWFTLIGAGAGGDSSTTAGSSGAVTNFMCPAFLIPDVLRVTVSTGGTAGGAGGQTSIAYYNPATYTLLTANGGQTAGVGATAMTANFFTAMGIFQSVAGQAGSTSNQTPSGTTFLSGGSVSGTSTANYGYTISGASNGFFQMQPIIVGMGAENTGKGGIGCGGGLANPTQGGDGLVVIITW